MKRSILIILALIAAVGLAIWIIKYAGYGCVSAACSAPSSASSSK